MTYSDIIKKFKIEYDKADTISSYPSLTDYEIKTILDKAYLALIAQKFTGNNPRRQAFETDIKAIEDLRGLVEKHIIQSLLTREYSTNVYTADISNIDMLYYVNSMLVHSNSQSSYVKSLIKLVDHQTAARFMQTDYNYPWIKTPVAVIENNAFSLIVDPDSTINSSDRIELIYVAKPEMFTESADTTNFQLSDSVAEELISLAISFALETVEQPRLSTKLQMNQLES